MDRQQCIRAQLVAAEHCGDFEDEFVEVDSDTFVVAPREVREDAERRADSPLDADEFEQMVRDQTFLREWLAGMCSTAGITPDDTDDLRECVRSFGERFTDESIRGDVTDGTVEQVAGAI